VSELVLQLPPGTAEDLERLMGEGYGRSLEDVALSLIRTGLIEFHRSERSSRYMAEAMGGGKPSRRPRPMGFQP
jgi:hypothetical protein